jgi:F-type H+-transporting ATP synthase subunit e
MASQTVTVRLISFHSYCIKTHTVQVVRYTALFSGVAYGLYHRSTLQKAQDLEKQHHAADRRERLIAEAKEAWKRKQESLGKDSGKTF